MDLYYKLKILNDYQHNNKFNTIYLKMLSQYKRDGGTVFRSILN